MSDNNNINSNMSILGRQMEEVRLRIDRMEDCFTSFCEKICSIRGKCGYSTSLGSGDNTCPVSKFLDYLVLGD